MILEISLTFRSEIAFSNSSGKTVPSVNPRSPKLSFDPKSSEYIATKFLKVSEESLFFEIKSSARVSCLSLFSAS